MSVLEGFQHVENALPPMTGIKEREMVGQKNDPGLAPIGPYGHGQGGVFNIQGTDDNIFSAMLMPEEGVLSVIPAYNAGAVSADMFGALDASLDTLLTGVTEGALDDFSQQPTTDCADGPVGGLTKVCTIFNPLGRMRAGLRELSLYRAGQRLDKCDPLSLRIMNGPALQGIFGVPDTTPSVTNITVNEWARRAWESAVSFRRMFSQRVWIGDPTNNSGERKDIVGLDIHINANNKRDAFSSGICTAANSVVLEFGYDLVGGGGRDIVEYVEMADYNARIFNAGRMRLSPVSGVLVVRPEVWWALSEVWPVRQYQAALNQMANFSAAGRVIVNATDAQSNRNMYRDQLILPINGSNVAVVVDDGIPYESNINNANLTPGQFASDMYYVPLTVMGGIPSTFFEYYNYDNEQAQGALRQLGSDSFTFTSDGGMFRWYINFKNGCITTNYEFSPRLKMKTPMVAWRINNVVTEPLIASRSPYPDDPYFLNGGNITGATASFYNSWSSTPFTPS